MHTRPAVLKMVVLAFFIIAILSAPIISIKSTHGIYGVIFFLEDSCWTLSWLLIAYASFKDKKAGFAPSAIVIALAVEVFLFSYYYYTDAKVLNTVLLSNYFLWPVASLINLLAIYKYSRMEFAHSTKPWVFFTRFFSEFIFFIIIFWFISKKLPPNLVMVYLGETGICMISIQFILMILSRDNLAGQSFSGNVIRFIGGLLCYYLNSLVRKSEIGQADYLDIIMPLSVSLDLAYLFIFIWKKNKLKSHGSESYVSQHSL